MLGCFTIMFTATVVMSLMGFEPTMVGLMGVITILVGITAFCDMEPEEEVEKAEQ